MSIKNLSIELHLTVYTLPNLVVQARQLDFDLIQQKLSRLCEKHGVDTGIQLDTLKVDSAQVRSSLYIKTLGDLLNFVNNMEAYTVEQTEKETLQSVSEYIACFDSNYHELNSSDVLSVISDVIHSSYHRSNKPKGEKTTKAHPIEVANNWMVLINQLA